jgi:peptidoglycan/xylan/chitin deacetylase (PgdA/CDA1 family)
VKEHVRPADIEDQVMMRARPGGIVLLHGGSPATALALPRLLRALSGAGYRLVLVSEVSAIRVQSTGSRGAHDLHGGAE